MWGVRDPFCVGINCDGSALASGEALFPSCFHWIDEGKEPAAINRGTSRLQDLQCWINPTWSSGKTPGLARKLHPLASACGGLFHPSCQVWDSRQERDVGTKDTPKSTGGIPGI